MKHSNPYSFIAWLAAVLLFTACSSENDLTDPQLEGLPVQVDINLSTTRQPTTRWDDSQAVNGEMMNNWIIIVTDTSDKIEQLISSASYAGEKEKDAISSIALASGTKHFYSFANVSLADIANGTPAIGTILSLKTTYPAPANGAIPATGIPMSNKQTIQILNVQQQTIELEVVRLMAKVTLQLANSSGTAITVNSATLSAITTATTAISLLPPASATKAASVASYTHPTTLSVPDGTTAASPQVLSFYINESALNATDAPPYHTLSLTTTQGTTTNELRYALLNWNSFSRNEHSIIPIALDDYRLTIVARDYPPIGVYPAVVVSNGEGTFTVTFSDGGDFELIPSITRLSDGAEMNFELASSGMTVLSGDPAALFVTPPTYNATTKEVVGTIGTTTGTVLYQFSFNVLNADSSVARTLTYKLYIIQQ